MCWYRSFYYIRKKNDSKDTKANNVWWKFWNKKSTSITIKNNEKVFTPKLSEQEVLDIIKNIQRCLVEITFPRLGQVEQKLIQLNINDQQKYQELTVAFRKIQNQAELDLFSKKGITKEEMKAHCLYYRNIKDNIIDKPLQQIETSISEILQQLSGRGVNNPHYSKAASASNANTNDIPSHFTLDEFMKFYKELMSSQRQILFEAEQEAVIESQNKSITAQELQQIRQMKFLQKLQQFQSILCQKYNLTPAELQAAHMKYGNDPTFLQLQQTIEAQIKAQAAMAQQQQQQAAMAQQQAAMVQ